VNPYQVFLYNRDKTLYAQLTDYHRLEYHQRLSSPWNAQLDFNLIESSDTLTLLRNLLDKEHRNKILIVRRYDSTADVWDKVYEGITTTSVHQTKQDSTILFNLYSQGYTAILNWREIVPAGEYQEESGPSETVLKAYASDNFSGTRSLDDLIIEATAGEGNLVDKSVRYNWVLSTAQSISEEGQLEFGVIGTYPPSSLVLQARAVWGDDRRVDYAVEPTIFSLERLNMENPILSVNAKDEVNVVYVGGEGQGADRVIYEVSNADLLASSPWGRKEGYTDARDETTIDGYRTAGRSYLEANKVEEKFTFNVKETRRCRWLRQWGLGDLITAYYADRRYDKKFTEIAVTVTPSGGESDEVISVEMDDVQSVV